MGKMADVLFTVPAGVPFCESSQFEPLIVTIVFPLAHVSSYTGPWTVKGTDMGLYYKQALAAGFSKPTVGPPTKTPRLEGPRGGGVFPTFEPTGGGGDTGQLHDVDVPLPGVFDDPEAGSRTLFRELLASAGEATPRAEVFGAESATRSQETITSSGWTTTKTAQTWRLMPPIPKIVIAVEGMGTT